MTLRMARTRLEPYLWALLTGTLLAITTLISPLVSLGILFGLGFAVLALTRPVMLCYVLVAAIVFLSGMPRGGVIPLLIPNEPILVVAAALAFFVMLARAKAPKLPRPVVFALGCMVFGTALIPTLAYYLRDFPLTTSDIFSLVAPVQYVVLVWLFASLPKNEADRYKIITFMLMCGSAVALIGLLEAARVGPVNDLIQTLYPSKQAEDAADLGRVTSILGAWNSLGNFLMINLIMVLAMHGYKQRARWGTANLVVNLALCGACLLASGSYASLFGLVLSLFIVKGFDRRGWKIILVFLVGMAVAGFFLQNLILERLDYQYRSGGVVPETLAYRFKVWQDIYFPMIRQNPLWGITPTFAGRVTWAWAESQYLYLLVRSGLISLIGHLAYVVTLMVWAFRRFRSPSEVTHQLAIALFAILAVLSIMGITNEVFTSSGAVDYVWIIVGLIAAGYRLKVENPTPCEVTLPDFNAEPITAMRADYDFRTH
ncbi:MAG: hypothetical protein IPK17_19320 [Chloroflexi bacterium]|uniref:O-antigen ligase family protein n=1 Tax=Candidatus Flexifilum breve TaxID=3140694 RepID=UPI0031348C12|nr:hypothetical protein [Chloroflexota bacterium]